jgi:hypothetical protein
VKSIHLRQLECELPAGCSNYELLSSTKQFLLFHSHNYPEKVGSSLRN